MITDEELETIRRRAVEAAKFVNDSIGTRVLEQDVPRLVAEIQQLRRGRRIVDAARFWRSHIGPDHVANHHVHTLALIEAVDAEMRMGEPT